MRSRAFAGASSLWAVSGLVASSVSRRPARQSCAPNALSAQLYSARLLLKAYRSGGADDPGLDVGKGRQLRGQRQTCRPAADDQDIDLLEKSIRGLPHIVRLGLLRDIRIAGSEPIEMELHG